MIRTIFKIIFLVLAIVYTFSNIVKTIRNQNLEASPIWMMAIGIVGFLAIQLEWV